MNSHLVSEPLVQRKGVIGVTTPRNSRALFVQEMACTLSLNIRGLDGPHSLMEKSLSRNLLRPDLISASLGNT